jgi:hypothetical protein
MWGGLMRVIITLLFLFPFFASAAVTLDESYPIAYKRYLQVKTVFIPIEEIEAYGLPEPCFITMVNDLRNTPWLQLVFSAVTLTFEHAKKAHKEANYVTNSTFAHLRINVDAAPYYDATGPDARMYIEPSCRRHRQIAMQVRSEPVTSSSSAMQDVNPGPPPGGDLE